MDGTVAYKEGKRNIYKIVIKNLKGRIHLADLGLCMGIILKLVLKKFSIKM
jgi:hypothetical protein